MLPMECEAQWQMQVEAFKIQCTVLQAHWTLLKQHVLPLTLDTDAHWPAEFQGLHDIVSK